MNYSNPASSKPRLPSWLWDVLRTNEQNDGAKFAVNGQPFLMRAGIPRSQALLSEAQAQTEEAFGFKWKKRDTFESTTSLTRMRGWLLERYGDVANAAWLGEYGNMPLVIDAGCGAGMSGLELLGSAIPRIKYLGIDVSEAVDVARDRFLERGLSAGFLQADITNLPLEPNSVDIIFSEGVLHHTNSTRGAVTSLSRLLKVGGRFLFYVYRRKGPIREFSDDYIRARIQEMSPKEAWNAMEPLTQLGISLGQLGAEIDIPAPIDVLGIPAGRINVQRLFYWHVAKAFYRPELSFDEMNHINYDWYAPANAHRQSIDEVREWCEACSLDVEREVVEEAGITVIAKKRA